MPRRLAIALAGGVALAAIAGVPAQAAQPGSIVYSKGGSIWAVSPSGKGKHRIPHTRGLSNPSQDDRGRIVAQKGINLYRLSRRGKRLNKPITTAYRTNPILTSFKGPFFPEVSPDGKKIAYTYSFTESHYDYNCGCVMTNPSLSTSYTYSNRFVSKPDEKFGLARFYYHSSWVGNKSSVGTTPDLYDYGGNPLNSVEVDPLGGGPDSYRVWFTECTSCDDITSFQKYPLDEPELTRKQDKAVFVSGDLDATLPGSALFLYPLAAPPTALPPHFCRVTGPNGKFASPSFSPNGRSLAWADRKGVWVGKLGSLDGDQCELTRKLVVKGGTTPDWGPARP
jgi:hypothetical protein